jgi:acyl carrier protein
MNTLFEIQGILSDQTGIGPDELLPARPLEELGIDSLAVTETMFRIEDEFKVVMPGGRVPIRTVQDIADLVDRLVREQAAVELGKQEGKGDTKHGFDRG